MQRELVIAWTCGALAVGVAGAAVGSRSLRSWLDWLPLVLVLSAYDLTRGAADSLGIGVHVHTMLDFDRFLVFGSTPTEWIQARLERSVRGPLVERRVHADLHVVLHRSLRGRGCPVGARDRLAFLRFRLGASWPSRSPAWPRTSPSRPPRRGWRPRTGLLHRRPADHLGGMGRARRRHRRPLHTRARSTPTRGRDPLAPRRVHGAGGDVPLVSRPTAVAGAPGALSAGHGPDADRDRRALLLGRAARLALRRRR